MLKEALVVLAVEEEKLLVIGTMDSEVGNSRTWRMNVHTVRNDPPDTLVTTIRKYVYVVLDEKVYVPSACDREQLRLKYPMEYQFVPSFEPSM